MIWLVAGNLVLWSLLVILALSAVGLLTLIAVALYALFHAPTPRLP